MAVNKNGTTYVLDPLELKLLEKREDVLISEDLMTSPIFMHDMMIKVKFLIDIAGDSKKKFKLS